MRFVALHGCPVPLLLARTIAHSLHDSGATLESCYRGQDPAGLKLLHRLGKSSQAELFRGYVLHRPGFNPANRPGTSTHELKSDGVAYSKILWPAGSDLQWWQCGMDIDDAHVDSFIWHLAKRGVQAFRPYPAGSERHHVNLRHRPPIRQLARPR
jgi:hypothetical protein